MVGGNLETAHLYMKYNAQFTPPEATRRDRFVASGCAVWIGYKAVMIVNTFQSLINSAVFKALQHLQLKGSQNLWTAESDI